MHESTDVKSTRRIAAAQQWLTDRITEARRNRFYGEIALLLRFVDGQCIMGEQSVHEKTK
ncbi:MAG: hypothetical protein JSS49_29785 [Planctomycetes bacterium]|nr:hypothetical protein [Planctomycetota bacterium]